jgi:hypothetical protein
MMKGRSLEESAKSIGKSRKEKKPEVDRGRDCHDTEKCAENEGEQGIWRGDRKHRYTQPGKKA